VRLDLSGEEAAALLSLLNRRSTTIATAVATHQSFAGIRAKFPAAPRVTTCEAADIRGARPGTGAAPETATQVK